jgi:hypothetical protein
LVQDNNSTFNVSMKFDDLTLANMMLGGYLVLEGFHTKGYNGC